MDRKRNKKVRKYLGVYIVFSILFSAFMYVLASYEMSTELQRMITLLTQHPELEAEIILLWEKPVDNRTGNVAHMDELNAAARMIQDKYGYDLRRTISEKAFFVFWGVGMLIGAAFIMLTGCLEWQRIGKGIDSEETFQELCECLEQFRAGNFHQIPDYGNAPEPWMKLWETVRELGIYFEDLKERLGAEEDSTKALITDISHQLKTPLASLRMSYELVTGDDVTEEEKREFQAQEENEIKKLETLLAELVNLSRLEKRMIQINPIPASLKNTITAAVSQVYMKARHKNIEIQVEMDEDIELCHDEKWTVEALVNVLDNAVKYSEERTMITVRVQPLVKNVLIEIEDEGMGLCPEELVKIYQRFYRGSKAKEKVKEGAGVGLYLSRMILERQGGTISARRKREQGTVFKITLPC